MNSPPTRQHLFPLLKQNLSGHEEEVETLADNRKRTDINTEKLAPRYDKCLSFGGDHVERQRDGNTVQCQLLPSELE